MTEIQNVDEAANKYADEHGFRVPYDGSNKFYDDNDVKWSKEGFLAGAEWQKNNSKVVVDEDELDKLFTKYMNDVSADEWPVSTREIYEEGYKAAIQSSTNHGAFSYLKSEQDFQIIAMRALGINYPENGYTFEQCINTVLFLAAQNKPSTKTFTLADIEKAFDAGGNDMYHAHLGTSDEEVPPSKEEYIQSLSNG